MLNDLLRSVKTIYIAYGYTDFRKQINSLCKIVQSEYNMNPYKENVAYIFCNSKKTSIKVLCFDQNGFILAQKTLMNVNKMKFSWPRNEKELKSITKQQLSWLLSGLEIYPKTYFKDIKIDNDEIAV